MYVRKRWFFFRFDKKKSGVRSVLVFDTYIHIHTDSTIYKKRYLYLESFGYELGIERLIHYIYKYAYHDRFNCNVVTARRRRRISSFTIPLARLPMRPRLSYVWDLGFDFDLVDHTANGTSTEGVVLSIRVPL